MTIDMTVSDPHIRLILQLATKISVDDLLFIDFVEFL